MLFSYRYVRNSTELGKSVDFCALQRNLLNKKASLPSINLLKCNNNGNSFVYLFVLLNKFIEVLKAKTTKKKHTLYQNAQKTFEQNKTKQNKSLASKFIPTNSSKRIRQKNEKIINFCFSLE